MQFRARSSLDGHRFDVVVVGGGVNGVAIARECAQAGLHTLLVEKRDFASGTTSRSTRIIHGGLRYLEHGEIGLVRESLHERERLLASYPNLVRPTNFVLALPHANSNRSALEVRFGLWLYHRMAGCRAGRLETRDQVKQLERSLDAGQRWTIFNYDDAQCEFPERLVAEWLQDSAAAGAVVRNHTELLEFVTEHGRATAAILRDKFTGGESRVESTWFINATGPWADAVIRNSAVVTGNPMIGGVRGSHLVLSRFAGAPETALYTEALDGRPIFMVPWNGQLLFGTTEIRDYGDPSRTEPDAAEVAYLMCSVQRLFPSAGISADMVRYAFAGVRPLPYAPEQSIRSVTRRSILHDHTDDGAAGLISIIGGKLTTAMSLARACARHIGVRVREPRLPAIAAAPADGISTTCDAWARAVSQLREIPFGSARAIAEWHGRRAACVAALAQSDERLREPLCPHTEHVAAEVLQAVQHEHAVTLGDILLRRVPVALSACWSAQCGRHAASVVAKALDWTEYERDCQLDAFEEERASFLRKPSLADLRSVPSERAA